MTQVNAVRVYVKMNNEPEVFLVRFNPELIKIKIYFPRTHTTSQVLAEAKQLANWLGVKAAIWEEETTYKEKQIL